MRLCCALNVYLRRCYLPRHCCSRRRRFATLAVPAVAQVRESLARSPTRIREVRGGECVLRAVILTVRCWSGLYRRDRSEAQTAELARRRALAKWRHSVHPRQRVRATAESSETGAHHPASAPARTRLCLRPRSAQRCHSRPK